MRLPEPEKEALEHRLMLGVPERSALLLPLAVRPLARLPLELALPLREPVWQLLWLEEAVKLLLWLGLRVVVPEALWLLLPLLLPAPPSREELPLEL